MGKTVLVMLAVMAVCAVRAEVKIPRSAAEDTDKVMSEKYWSYWNDDVQKKIDADIEANRKADASLKLDGAAKGTKVSVEQISHDFIFGAHIFNFNQLGDKSINAKYRSLFGSLFNSATIPFYWDKFELEPGRPRFCSEYWDLEEYWNGVKDPKMQIHWRRPPTDDIVKFCKQQNIRIHGHPLAWGNRQWQVPAWLFEACTTPQERQKLDTLIEKYPERSAKNKSEKYTKKYGEMTPKQIAEYIPEFTERLNKVYVERIQQICRRYADLVDSWDVTNESSTDFGKGVLIPGDKICKSHYGIMPGDYPWLAFQAAQKILPQKARLNLNDYNNKYTAAEAKDLIKRGCKVDIIGSQMHLFKPKSTLDIAAGAELRTPDEVEETMKGLDIGLPIHLSEITITAPDTTQKGRMMQAIILRNLYRKWFSIKPMMGITWWNVVDDCGAPGEPSMSGLFTRGMNPKPAFFALDGLINKEWKTILDTEADDQGKINFRGFRGKYRISWTDKDGNERSLVYHLK